MFEDLLYDISFSHRKRQEQGFFCHRTVCTIVSHSEKKEKNIKKETISFHLGTLTFLTNINVYSIVLNMHTAIGDVYLWITALITLLLQVCLRKELERKSYFSTLKSRDSVSIQRFKLCE